MWELEEEFSQLSQSVEQRLRWAAGANAEVAQVLSVCKTGVRRSLGSVADLRQNSIYITRIVGKTPQCQYVAAMALFDRECSQILCVGRQDRSFGKMVAYSSLDFENRN